MPKQLRGSIPGIYNAVPENEAEKVIRNGSVMGVADRRDYLRIEAITAYNRIGDECRYYGETDVSKMIPTTKITGAMAAIAERPAAFEVMKALDRIEEAGNVQSLDSQRKMHDEIRSIREEYGK